MFQNPIGTQTGAASSGSPISTPNTAVGDLAGAALTGLQLWSNRQQSNAIKAQKVEEAKADNAGAVLASQRLQRYNELKDNGNLVAATRYLRDTQLEDIQTLDPVARKSYLDMTKKVSGNFVQQTEQDADIARIEAEQKRLIDLRNEGFEYVAGTGTDPNSLSDDQLQWIATSVRGKKARMAEHSAQLSITQSEMNIESQERQRNTGAALGAFGIAFDTKVSSNIMKVSNAVKSGRYSVPVINPETGIMEPKVFTGEEAIKKAREDAINNILEAQSQLPALMRSSVREMGGDPSLVSQADITLMQNQLDRVREYITGADLGKLNQQQFDALLSTMSLEYIQNASDHGIELAIAKVTGVPMASRDVQLAGRLVPEGMTMRDPLAAFIKNIDETYKYGPATTAARTGNPKEAVKENTSTVLAGMTPQMLDDDAKRSRTADMVYRTFAEAASNDPEVSLLANGKGGAIRVHEELARNPQKAKQLSSDLAASAAKHGTTLEQVYVQEINNLSRNTIIPSLGLKGLRRASDFKGGEVITVDVKNGLVKFELDQSRRVKSNTPYGRDDTTTEWNRRRTMLDKAEKDLNTILLSYKNTTGADGAALANAAVAAFREVLGQDVEEDGEQ